MYDDNRPFYEVHQAYIRRRIFWSRIIVVALTVFGCALMLFGVWEVGQ